MKEFNVMEFDFNSKKAIKRDVLPYFRSMWEDKKWDSFGKSKVKTKEEFKGWVLQVSAYQFWARCEYEFVVGSWPFGSYKYKERMMELGACTDENYLDICNAALMEMEKIDIHDQIKMNIDIITDILYSEFFEI